MSRTTLPAPFAARLRFVAAGVMASALTARAETGYPRPVSGWLEAQVALERRDFSCGLIDGAPGEKSAAALEAFQDSRGLPTNGALDDATCAALTLDRPPLTQRTIGADDLAGIQPLSDTWVGKSEQTALAYDSALQMVAGESDASEALIRRLNPSVDWTKVTAGTTVTVPDPERRTPREPAARLLIQLSRRVLEAYDGSGALIAHFPVGIAVRVDKRPVGELRVTVVVRNPNYTFDPAMFSDAEARTLDHKLILPPGPNNPVGLAWIGLNLPGYGIHGTSEPESVGRAASHGCFRLTNWDARTLLSIVRRDLPVVVLP